MLVQLCVSCTASFLFINIKSYGGPPAVLFSKKMIGLLLKKRIIKQHNSHSKSLAICAIWLIFFLAIYVIWVVCKNEQNPLIKKHFSKLVSYFQARGQWRWKTPFWNRKHLWKTGCHIGSSSHHSLVLGKHNNQLSLISNQWGMIFILLGFFSCLKYLALTPRVQVYWLLLIKDSSCFYRLQRCSKLQPAQQESPAPIWTIKYGKTWTIKLKSRMTVRTDDQIRNISFDTTGSSCKLLQTHDRSPN